MNTPIKIVIYTSMIWLTLFASCASSEMIKTWIIEENGLRHHTSDVNELKTFVEAAGYRCYSASDDTAWRNRMAVCCGSANVETLPSP